MRGKRNPRLGRTGSSVLAFLLWAITSALGFVEIWIVREMALRVFARFFADESAYGRDYWAGVTFGNCLAIILGVIWIALVMGGGEYHHKYVGRRRSWRLFTRTIAVQLAILLLAWFI